jgi:chaperonin GroES
MTVRPLHERLVVRRIEENGTAEVEILIPDRGKRKPWKGEVLSVGSGKDVGHVGQVVLDVRVGDTVLFGKESGIDVTIGGEELLILPENEFLVILRESRPSSRVDAPGPKPKSGRPSVRFR